LAGILESEVCVHTCRRNYRCRAHCAGKDHQELSFVTGNQLKLFPMICVGSVHESHEGGSKALLVAPFLGAFVEFCRPEQESGEEIEQSSAVEDPEALVPWMVKCTAVSLTLSGSRSSLIG
jgi:hypothetical protein